VFPSANSINANANQEEQLTPKLRSMNPHTRTTGVTPPGTVSFKKHKDHISLRSSDKQNIPAINLRDKSSAANSVKHQLKKKKSRNTFSRRLWDESEDIAVSELVSKYGTKKWSLVAEMLDVVYKIKGRTGKQCRERWHNHLDPVVQKEPLSAEEERQIFEGHKKHGNKWADIAKELKGRTDNVVKNYFYATLRRQLRKISKYIKGKRKKDPSEITLQYIHQIMKDHTIPYSALDNDNVREAIEELDGIKPTISHQDSKSHSYALRKPIEAKRVKYEESPLEEEKNAKSDISEKPPTSQNRSAPISRSNSDSTNNKPLTHSPNLVLVFFG